MGKTIMGTSNFFKEEQERFNWFGKEVRKGYSRNDRDVTVNIVYKTKADKAENKNPYITLTFRNGVRHLFADNEYALIAVVKNRIFFKESDLAVGEDKVIKYDDGSQKTIRKLHTKKEPIPANTIVINYNYQVIICKNREFMQTLYLF